MDIKKAKELLADKRRREDETLERLAKLIDSGASEAELIAAAKPHLEPQYDSSGKLVRFVPTKDFYLNLN